MAHYESFNAFRGFSGKVMKDSNTNQQAPVRLNFKSSNFQLNEAEHSLIDENLFEVDGSNIGTLGASHEDLPGMDQINKKEQDRTHENSNVMIL